MIYFGDNSDQYTGNGKIWEIAKRFNDESKRLNGHVAAVRRRKVERTERIHLL